MPATPKPATTLLLFAQTLLSIQGLLEEALNEICANTIKTCCYDSARGAAGTIDTWQG